ncbi:P-loop containing nucleoside triphosphate hydrolase protein [Pterulicium gracile]|uniref:DNA 3'-5' helicase n=1 Tax=Pterulicium gracile TaxID=1884261 RepID=A0A5C3R0A0_9AGAR|nr:P-loop containing nucleoside triphosphate hydrolase protein [Pterula gracilis]
MVEFVQGSSRDAHRSVSAHDDPQELQADVATLLRRLSQLGDEVDNCQHLVEVDQLQLQRSQQDLEDKRHEYAAMAARISRVQREEEHVSGDDDVEKTAAPVQYVVGIPTKYCGPQPWSRNLRDMADRVIGKVPFYEYQEAILNAVTDRQNVFAIMPTNSGKTLTFLLPAQQEHKLTLVICPTNSLILDQLARLEGSFISAIRLTGECSYEGRSDAYDALGRLINHNTSLLCYTTPEYLLQSETFKELLAHLYEKGKLARTVVDEVHCMLETGGGFRPHYRHLGKLRTMFPSTPVLLLSATCPPPTVDEIMDLMKMPRLTTLVIRQSVYRRNLHYSVVSVTRGNMLEEISTRIHQDYHENCGIVYCMKRKQVDKVTEFLREEGINAVRYHAGMAVSDKTEAAADWRADRAHVMVATSAFGLGINKSDVRFVIHLSCPESLEAYVQQTGRAGRDGQDAGCILLFRPKDCLASIIRATDRTDGALAMLRYALTNKCLGANMAA